MIGHHIAQYEIVEEIGAGGMGVVYRAIDTRLDRAVAIKGLSEQYSSDRERLSRLEREARAIAALNHPNIVTIHGIEEVEGRPLLVMELVEGKMLSESIPPHGLPLSELLALAIPIADALSCAHEHSIVHRDLKPSNIMITEDRRVKILDFGLAKLDPRPRGDDTRTQPMTRVGSVAGTLPYMSPEQVSEQQVDHRTDIFSLGVILFEMATGSRPFPARNLGSLMSGILNDQPPTISEIKPELPTHFARIVGLCLEKDPKQRHQSARDVLNQLELLRRETESFEVSRAHLPAPRRLRKASMVAGLSGVALLAALGLRWWNNHPPGEHSPTAEQVIERPMIVVLPFENLGPSSDAYFTAGMTEEITSRLGAVRGLGVISRNSALTYADGTKTTRQIGEELGVDYVLEGSVRWARPSEPDSKPQADRIRISQQLIRVSDETHLWSESYDRTLEDIFAIQTEIAEKVVTRLGMSLLAPVQQQFDTDRTKNIEAYTAYLRARDRQRTIDFDRRVASDSLLVADLEEAIRIDPGFVAARAELIQHHSIMVGFQFDESQERRTKLDQELEHLLRLETDSPLVNRALGFYHQVVTRDYHLALEQYQHAATALPNDERIRRNLGSALRRMGRWQEAADQYELALRLDPRSATAANRLGTTLTYLRQYRRALELFDIAIALRTDQTTAYVGKAEVHWLWTGDIEAGRSALIRMPRAEHHAWYWQNLYESRYRDAIRQLEATDALWIGRPKYWRPKSLLLGYAHQLAGNRDQASTHFAAAENQLRAELSQSSVPEKLWSALGVALAGQGLREEALAAGRRAIELTPLDKEPFFGQVHVEDLAWVHALLGDPELAATELDRLLSTASTVSPELVSIDPRWRLIGTSPAGH